MQMLALLKDVFASHTSLDAQSAQAWNFEIDARKGNVMSATISLGKKKWMFISKSICAEAAEAAEVHSKSSNTQTMPPLKYPLPVF